MIVATHKLDKPSTLSKSDWENIWQHFNRMQVKVMCQESLITRKDFFAETEEERISFYNWMQQQVVEYACYV